MEVFSCKTKILCGRGAISGLKEFEAKRVFLVTDPYFMKNGTARRVGEATGAAEIQYFDGVQPDPTVALAAEGTAKLKQFQPDLLVALGGGSALDCGKAMAYFAQGTFPLATIPTTSGSGSEVTDFAILTHGKAKHPLVDARLRPDMAVLDSDFLESMPKTLVADTGFDVLTHAMESYAAKGAGSFSDVFAREAFRMAYANLPASFAGRQEARMKVHLASTMAGLSFTHAGLGLCHALSHALGGMFHVPHGRLNAILLPAVMDCNAHAVGSRYAELARAAGMGGSADAVALRNLKNGLLRLRRELGLPQTLVQAGVNPREIWSRMPELVESVLEDGCAASNPLPVEDFMIRRVLEEVMGRA